MSYNSYNQRRGSDGPRGGRRGSSRRSGPDPSSLPLEQGLVCSLKESFGFIHCADRPEEIFFHYSEVRNCHPDELDIDSGVEFRVGQSGKDPTKRAAYEVYAIDASTIQWETEDEPDKLYQGLVERSIRTDGPGGRGDNNNNSKSSNQEGSIQVQVQVPESADASNAPKGPLVRFRTEDLQEKNGRLPKLFRGDLVQFRIFLDRRTKQRYARHIEILQTEKERTRAERERKMLESATPEEGMVISLNKGYGFLKSNKRHGHIYFHYSNLIVPTDENGTEIDFELKKGQEMKFLVATEVLNGESKSRALQLECLPPGTVEFHTTIATGVKGTITLCPRPPTAGRNLGYADDRDGSIRLLETIMDTDDEGNPVTITEVSFEFNDSPGGVYEFQQRGSATNGLWVLEGDTVLFDVVKELADGSYQAAPTSHTLGMNGAVEEPDAATPTDASIRLAACSLTGRAEGTMHTLKLKGGYGFIHFAERTIDVHFNAYNLIPEPLQADLRRQLGYPGEPIELEGGVGVQFDIAQHGVVYAGGRGNGGGGGGGGRRRGSPHERENMKAHRILLLPPDAILMDKALATSVKGVVKSVDRKQLYAGFVDLEKEIQPMSNEERHPLVVKMILSFLEQSAKDHGPKQLVFKDSLSKREESVVISMVEEYGNGCLSCDQKGSSDTYPGVLRIRRVEEDAEKKDAKPRRGRSKDTPSASVRFDKSGLIKDLQEDQPPNIGDEIECDVIQSRRTGKIMIRNLKIVKRSEIDPADICAVDSSEASLGIVQNVVPRSSFGFISVLDENAVRQELLFFSLGDNRNSNFRKGDEVKFGIGVDKKTGKRVAQNVTMVKKGTIPAKVSKNACKGIVLMEPTHTTLSNTPKRKQGGDSKWGDGKETRKGSAETLESGVILLLEDKTGMFTKRGGRRKRSRSVDTTSSDDASVGDLSIDSADTTGDDLSVGSVSSHDSIGILSHVRYANGALAITGPGAAGGIDSANYPRRGDIVTFVKSRKGSKARDIRVESRKAATLVRGRLESIQSAEASGLQKNAGSAKFFAATAKEEQYDVDLVELVSCDTKLLKDKQQVEGVLHEGGIFGVCRTVDLYLESKLGTSHKERPKLNLSVKKTRGGTIMAQTMMAKGPDGTVGFAPGWTARESQYAVQAESPQPTPDTSS